MSVYRVRQFVHTNSRTARGKELISLEIQINDFLQKTQGQFISVKLSTGINYHGDFRDVALLVYSEALNNIRDIVENVQDK